MHIQHTNKDYSNYTFEDFLKDDFFILSVTSPGEESERFWNELRSSHKIDNDAFTSAKQFLIQLNQSSNELVVDEELDSLWQSIQHTNQKNRKTRKRLYIRISAAAACIAAIMCISYIAGIFRKERVEDLITFVQNNSMQIETLSDIQLMVSEDKVVQIQEKELEIVYDSAKIKISAKEEILRTEPTAMYNQLAVPKGKRSTLKLSDGTFLHVNAGTVVTYPTEFAADKREIYVDGEVFIDVTPDASRPFIVKTSDVDVQVLGTRFNVMAYGTDANKQIVLASGSVKILAQKNEKEIILEPSQMYQYDKNTGSKSISKVDLNKYTTWVDGLYNFESERLDVVMLRLSRYYGKKIAFDAKIADLKCTGNLALKEDLSDVLSGLSFSFPIDVKYENDEYQITKKAK